MSADSTPHLSCLQPRKCRGRRGRDRVAVEFTTTCPVSANRQTSGESASLPQYLGCYTVFNMRLRVTFLRRKTVSLQSNNFCVGNIMKSEKKIVEDCDNDTRLCLQI
jgi:hypothetical protein